MFSSRRTYVRSSISASKKDELSRWPSEQQDGCWPYQQQHPQRQQQQRDPNGIREEDRVYLEPSNSGGGEGTPLYWAVVYQSYGSSSSSSSSLQSCLYRSIARAQACASLARATASLTRATTRPCSFARATTRTTTTRRRRRTPSSIVGLVGSCSCHGRFVGRHPCRSFRRLVVGLDDDGVVGPFAARGRRAIARTGIIIIYIIIYIVFFFHLNLAMAFASSRFAASRYNDGGLATRGRRDQRRARLLGRRRRQQRPDHVLDRRRRRLLDKNAVIVMRYSWSTTIIVRTRRGGARQTCQFSRVPARNRREQQPQSRQSTNCCGGRRGARQLRRWRAVGWFCQ